MENRAFHDMMDAMVMEPAIALVDLQGAINEQESGCTGSACPCSTLVPLLHKAHGEIAKLLCVGAYKYSSAYFRVFTNLADALVCGKHTPESQLACAEAHYRCEQAC
jgi:hypothetical protein